MAIGPHEEAIKLIQELMPMAQRNVGEDHAAILAARSCYARMLVQLERYEEAAEIFNALTRKPQYQKISDEDGDNPDLIAQLWLLADCLGKQQKFQEALDICEDVVVAIHEIGRNGLGSKHKFASSLQTKIAELKQKVRNDVGTKERILLYQGAQNEGLVHRARNQK